MASSPALEILKDLFVRTDFDRARLCVTFTRPAAMGGGAWEIRAGRRRVAGGRLPAGRRVRFDVPLPGFTPWTLDDPFLYTLLLTARVAGQPRRLECAFGMRKFHIANRQIFMNNQPLCVRGAIRGREAHDHQNLGGLSETDFYAKYIRAARSLGFNYIRFHSTVPPPAYFEAADRLGILTHVESRKYYGKYQKERELMDHDPVLVRPRQWRDMILAVRNHPSLMTYCLGNEINAPGRNPEVRERAAQLRKLDPTALFIDTCARGEYDREGIDFDVQHMGYFAPFGKDLRMYDTTDNWAIFGSAKGETVVAGDPRVAQTRRALEARVPVLAHEVGHNIVHRDLEALRRKFRAHKAAEPWWIGELLKLRALKGLERDYPRLVAASRHFQLLWYKQVFESVRRSPLLGGFNFLQLADTDRYENANGLLDCFDDLNPGVRPAEVLRFNGDSVLLADLPRRTFFEGERLAIPVHLSHFGALRGAGHLRWRLRAAEGGVDLQGGLPGIAFRPGLQHIAEIVLRLPATAAPAALELTLQLQPAEGAAIRNAWPLWLFPNRPERVPEAPMTAALDTLDPRLRYPRLNLSGSLARPARLLLVNRFDEAVFRHLERGGDVLLLHRVPETRDRQAPRERFYLPATWERFKPVIWDRGHNLGAFMRPHPALERFPAGEFMDFQFAGLVNDCDKLCLDDFPAPVEPIIQGVDKAVRDRYDVFTFKLSELQPAWTMRKFAYLFDLRVGRGRLLVCGFNFQGLAAGVPECCGMFEALLATAASPTWRPAAALAPAALRDYLARKGREPRIKERMMTQYWQLDDAPLESAAFWKEAEAWIRQQ
jgi:hypothetical protein